MHACYGELVARPEYAKKCSMESLRGWMRRDQTDVLLNDSTSWTYAPEREGQHCCKRKSQAASLSQATCVSHQNDPAAACHRFSNDTHCIDTFPPLLCFVKLPVSCLCGILVLLSLFTVNLWEGDARLVDHAAPFGEDASNLCNLMEGIWSETIRLVLPLSLVQSVATIQQHHRVLPEDFLRLEMSWI